MLYHHFVIVSPEFSVLARVNLEWAPMMTKGTKDFELTLTGMCGIGTWLFMKIEITIVSLEVTSGFQCNGIILPDTFSREKQSHPSPARYHFGAEEHLRLSGLPYFSRVLDVVL